MPHRPASLIPPVLCAMVLLHPVADASDMAPGMSRPLPVSAIPDPPLPKPRPDRSMEVPDAAAMPASERRCRRALSRAGARFTDAPPLDDPENGCRIAHPVLLDQLGADIRVEPPALLNCPMARATVDFLHQVVVPSAEHHFDTAPATIVQVSAYVCRTRHGTDTVSEHALGNALDWGAIVLETGEVIEVREHEPEEQERQDFLDEIREAACGPFTTVLGPGTDEDHEDHFHFDLAERSGGAFCR